MAKRRESLAPLAHNHHEALRFALRLQRGSCDHLKLCWHTPELQTQHAVAFYDQHPKRHFAGGEILFPHATRYIPLAQPTFDDLIAEHCLIESSFSRFLSMSKFLKDDPNSLRRLRDFQGRTEDMTLFHLVSDL